MVNMAVIDSMEWGRIWSAQAREIEDNASV